MIGGITYRTFPGTPAARLGEIAFCAVAQTLQVWGQEQGGAVQGGGRTAGACRGAGRSKCGILTHAGAPGPPPPPQVTGYGTRLMNWTKVLPALCALWLAGWRAGWRAAWRGAAGGRRAHLRTPPPPPPPLPAPAQHFARQQDGLEYFLTYADNNAVGYFAKQSFTKTVTLEKDKVRRRRAAHMTCGGASCARARACVGCVLEEGWGLHGAGRLCALAAAHASCPRHPLAFVLLYSLQWFGFIKDYDGGTLMECRIHPTLPYAAFPGALHDALGGWAWQAAALCGPGAARIIPAVHPRRAPCAPGHTPALPPHQRTPPADMLAQQRGALEREVKRYTTGHVVHPGLPHWEQGGGPMPVEEIPGAAAGGGEEVGALAGWVWAWPLAAAPARLARAPPTPRAAHAGVVGAGWTHAAGMLHRGYQIAMGGQILDPTEVRALGVVERVCLACRWRPACTGAAGPDSAPPCPPHTLHAPRTLHTPFSVSLVFLPQDNLHAFMGMLLKKAQRHADAGPFLRPVPPADVPDYYTIIIVRAAWGCALAALLRQAGSALAALFSRRVSCTVRPPPAPHHTLTTAPSPCPLPHRTPWTWARWRRAWPPAPSTSPSTCLPPTFTRWSKTARCGRGRGLACARRRCRQQAVTAAPRPPPHEPPPTCCSASCTTAPPTLTSWPPVASTTRCVRPRRGCRGCLPAAACAAVPLPLAQRGADPWRTPSLTAHPHLTTTHHKPATPTTQFWGVMRSSILPSLDAAGIIEPKL